MLGSTELVSIGVALCAHGAVGRPCEDDAQRLVPYELEAKLAWKRLETSLQADAAK